MLEDNKHYLKSAYILPSRVNDFGGGKSGKVLFGVVDNKLKLHINHIRGDREWSDPEARIDYIKNNLPIDKNGSWIYGGPLFYHFGHFMSESLSRIWAYSELKDDVNGVIFTVPPYMNNPSLSNFMCETFSLLGIDLNKIVLTNKFLKVEKLIVPEQGTILGKGEKPWFNDKLKLNKEVLTGADNKNSLFVSRKNYVNKGRVMGMGYYERVMKNAGVKIIYPEELSLKQQVQEMINHNTLIFEEGSALHILEVIPRQNKKIILLKRREGDSYLDVLIKQKSEYTESYSLIKESPKYFDNDQRHNVCARLEDPKDFFDFLSRLNLVLGSDCFSKEEFICEEETDIKNYLLTKVREHNEYFR